jgi:hypothetical protein
MKMDSPEVEQAITEFAYGAKAQYAYEKMRTSTTKAEKLAWKTKMVTNKCARAGLINARKWAARTARFQKTAERIAKIYAKRPNIVKVYEKNLEKAQVYEAAINAHMKLCPTWALYTHKQSRQYQRELWKKRNLAYRVWAKARTPANYMAYYAAHTAYYAYAGKWHSGATTCRCSTNLIKRYAKPIVRRYRNRVWRLERRYRKTKSKRTRRIIRKRITRAKLRKITISRCGQGRHGRRYVRRVIRRYRVLVRRYRRTKNIRRRRILYKRLVRYRVQYRTIVKWRRYRIRMHRRRVIRRTIRRRVVRRRVVRRYIRRIRGIRR